MASPTLNAIDVDDHKTSTYRTSHRGIFNVLQSIAKLARSVRWRAFRGSCSALGLIHRPHLTRTTDVADVIGYSSTTHSVGPHFLGLPRPAFAPPRRGLERSLPFQDLRALSGVHPPSDISEKCSGYRRITSRLPHFMSSQSQGAAPGPSILPRSHSLLCTSQFEQDPAS